MKFEIAVPGKWLECLECSPMFCPGTCTGPLADIWGRKKMALSFSVIYTFCCLTKLSPNYWWLFTGRIFGGIATSMLFSTFESWYGYLILMLNPLPST